MHFLVRRGFTKNVNEKSPERITEIRKLILNNDYIKSRELCREIIGEKLNFGTNLPVGNIKIEFNSNSSQYKNFLRELDLRTGIARVRYEENNNEFSREIFVSNPHQVMVIKLTSRKAGKLAFELGFNGFG